MREKLEQVAKQIKLVIFDIDGVLTNGQLFYDNQGNEYKAFNSKDGQGMRMLLDSGVEIALITGRKSELVKHRAANLKLSPSLIYQGYRDKIPAFKDLLVKTGLTKEQIAYVGDDVLDLPIMKQVGLSIAVADANWFVRENADWVSQEKGGEGAAREICELILNAQGKLNILLENYLNPEL